jgi:hypothetical protein
MYKCKYCNKEFNKSQSLAAHISHCKLNPNYNEEIDKLRQNKGASKGANKRKETSLLNKKERILICKHCCKEYKLNLTDKEFENEKYSKFCSRSCANSRQHSEETKLKISKSLIKKDNIHICKVCKKQYKYVRRTDTTQCFCSHECLKYFKTHFKEFLSEEAKQSLHNFGVNNVLKLGDLKRSKNEIEFYKLCESYFNNVEHNKPIFNGWDADVIIHDIKYTILWNGKWHYEQITKSHSVKQVQNRDKIKIEEIKKYGYIPYIIKDMGGYNLNFVKKEFNKFIQNIHGGSLAQD